MVMKHWRNDTDGELLK